MLLRLSAFIRGTKPSALLWVWFSFSKKLSALSLSGSTLRCGSHWNVSNLALTSAYHPALWLRYSPKISIFSLIYIKNMLLLQLIALPLTGTGKPLLVPMLAQSGVGAGSSSALLVSANLVPGKAPKQQRNINHRYRHEDALLRDVFHRFSQNLFGTLLALSIVRNVMAAWSISDMARVWTFHTRLLRAVPIRGTTQLALLRHPWRHGAGAFMAAVKLRDPSLLIRWLQFRLQRMSMFRHRRFFRLLGIFLRSTLTSLAPSFRLRGVYMYLVGKISVTGNAMSRSYTVRAGLSGNSNLKLAMASGHTIVRTSTGCLGLTINFFF